MSSASTPGRLVLTSFAVMPFTIFDSSIQLRPCSGKLFHLPAIDVARHLRRGGVDERRFGGDGERLGDLGDHQHDRDGGVLADQQLHFRQQHRAKARRSRLQLVGAGR